MNNNISQKRIQNEINILERKSYRVSTLYGTIILFIYGLLISLVLIFSGINIFEAVIYFTLFALVSGISGYLWYKDIQIIILKRFSYISIIFVYIFITYLLFNSSLPGIYANIFLAFTVGYLYLDEKATWINHILMAISSSLLIWIFPEIFGLENLPLLNVIIVNLVLIIVLVFLFISSLFNLRKKRYNYYKLAKLRENEFKIIHVLIDLENEYFTQRSNSEDTYPILKELFKQFSTKVGIENVFDSRIELVSDAHKLDLKEFKEKHPNLTEEMKNYLESLSLQDLGKLRFIAIKISQLKKVEINYSMNQEVFNSLRHFEDDQLVKLVVFSAFFVYFRLNKRELKAISTEEFISLLNQSGLVNEIEPKILNIFYKYQDVIEEIIFDAINGGQKL
jgi:hypothetical protein